MDNDALFWLPEREDWSQALRASVREGGLDGAKLMAFAGHRLDFTMTLMLDRAMRQVAGGAAPAGFRSPPARLAVLGSATLDHLLPGIRVGALRRGLWVETYAAGYGQYLQELADPSADLARFEPTCVLLALDGVHLVGELDATATIDVANDLVDKVVQRCEALWERARRQFGCRIIQQLPLPVFQPLLGHNESRLPGSKARALARTVERLRDAADRHGVDLLSLDTLVAQQGLDAWHDPSMWFKAKHEVKAAASPLYGDHVGRLLGAQLGRAAKCLVLDLDNTLWGGVIGDDGLEGIVLGQGNALGEAYLALQRYVRELAQRGVILAVCSKNDEANALLPFEKHPEMVLRRSDIACFVANWNDKASNLRHIATTLNIGLDSLVFLDDNPFERHLVRTEVPEVAVPELPEDPALYLRCLAAGGYFETVSITAEDALRSAQYQANAARERIKETATDLAGYLRELEMQLTWQRFDPVGVKRVAQLINKTNQFNLTTRRSSEEEVRALVGDAESLTLQLRLTDRFGDNGIIAIVIARPRGPDLHIQTWLMSCRVLGREVEQATLNLVVAEALRLGAGRVIGEYLPTPKNQMVAQHYARLGFTRLDETGTLWALDLAEFEAKAVPMRIIQTSETVHA